ncbi:hypothetical protein CVT24_001222 [Panaeolus cyanescens]|uniref:Uncharacterized protein n=1 Tax=Panaeolus cyanescens TaxID=181874 RepID=A0A409YFV4_9AGAR|nr:hypothetical protein CVT24_001222 [Panaeolus cyanescens]
MPLPTNLDVEFRPSSTLPNEQPAIIDLCRRVWVHPAFKSSKTVSVYHCKKLMRNPTWWHTNAHDRREHITVRFNLRTERAHIYRDGTFTVNPRRPAKGPMVLKSGGDEDYDTVSELSGEEHDGDE